MFRPTIPLLMLFAATLASAQQLLGEVPASGPIGSAYDFDGDGYGDVYVGPVVYSGLDLSPLFDAQSYVMYFFWDMTVLDDWDGDGTPDVVLADRFGEVTGRAVVVSGADGSILDVLCFGLCDPIYAVANMGDLDGDGRDELALNWEFSFERDAHLTILPSGGGAALYDDEAYPQPDFLWPTGLGDVDLDGARDWAVLRTEFFPDSGQAEIHSVTAGLLGTIDVVAATYQPLVLAGLGAIGDVDGDGRADFAVSSLSPDDHTRVYSGADFTTVLHQFPFFEFLAGPGDVDCDGVPDLLLGDDGVFQDAGRAELRSGADGSLLWSVTGAPGDRLGGVAAAGDVNADGVADWLVTAVGGQYTRIYSGIGPSIATYCTGKPTSAGCTPTVDWAGPPTLSGPDDFLVLARNVLAHKSGLFFFGTSGSAALPFLGGTLCVQPPLVRTPPQASLGGPDCSAGYAFLFDQALAQAQGLAAGTTVHGQFWMRDPAQPDGTGVALSDAIALDWCP